MGEEAITLEDVYGICSSSASRQERRGSCDKLAYEHLGIEADFQTQMKL